MKPKSYKEKIECIRKAIKEGKKFYVDTHMGRLRVQAITDPEGSWAQTGTGFQTQSWMICSTDVNKWYEQISNKEV